MTSNLISEIVEKRIEGLDKDKEYYNSLRKKDTNKQRRSLSKALKEHNSISIISEIKYTSPSLGEIRHGADIKDIKSIVSQMESAGVVGLSVLTEPNYFKGSYENLKNAIKISLLSCLMKDFIVHEIQISIGYKLGASNILLINSVLKNALKDFVDIALKQTIEPLIEIHDQEEIKDILNVYDSGRRQFVVGVNNRNLKTQEIDLDTSKTLIPLIKNFLGKKILVISESGINSHDDIQNLLSYGADGFLIGSAIMKSSNIKEKILELRGEV